MSEQLSPQQRIGGYTILDRLAHGPYGERWVGEASGVGRVAVSLLVPELAADEAARALFHEEMAVAARLVHPNILRVIESGIDRGRPFVVTELFSGETLDVLLARESAGALSASVVARIGRDACRGLIYAHAAEPPDDLQVVLHRDLSPRSLFVTTDGHTKIVGFGVASAIQRLAQLRSLGLKGSVDYMSPEQIRGAKLDVRSDLFALGAVLFEALTGEPPFEGESLAERGTKPLPFQGLEGHDGIQAIITRALQADPERRFASAKEMAEELEQLLLANTDDLRKMLKDPSKDKAVASIQLFSFDAAAFAPKPFRPSLLPKQEESTKEIIAALETSWNDLSDVSESGPFPALEDLASTPIVGLHKQALAAQSPIDQKLSRRELAIVASILAVLSLSFALGYLFLGRSLRQSASPHARQLGGTVGGVGDLPALELPRPSSALWRPSQLTFAAELPAEVKASTVTSTSSAASKVVVIMKLGDRSVPAEVSVDGRVAGIAPVEIRLLPGHHKIRVRPSGAAAMERDVQVRTGIDERVVFDLEN